MQSGASRKTVNLWSSCVINGILFSAAGGSDATSVDLLKWESSPWTSTFNGDVSSILRYFETLNTLSDHARDGEPVRNGAR